MPWLLSKIVANPMVLAFLLIGAFLFGVSSGGSAAWWIQGLKTTSAKLETKKVQQELTTFRQEQTRIFQEHEDAADKQRQASSMAYEAAKKQLADSVASGDVYRRCVMAGRCGPARNSVGLCKQSTNTSGVGISAPRIIDATVSNTIPTTGNDAAINDCAVTTLQLNQLQQDIEAQPGYRD